MKRMILTAVTLCLLLAVAKAQEIPSAVRGLYERIYPGYAVLAQDGYDDGKNGQWALVLNKNGDNVLLLAERESGGDYALTVNNPNAMPDEGEAYSRDTHTIRVKFSDHDQEHGRPGELTMTIEQPGAMRWVLTSELMKDGRTWGNVISEYTIMGKKENTVWWSHLFVEDGSMNYMRHMETPDGKPLSTDMYPRVPVKGEAARAHLLGAFDASLYPYLPDRMNGGQLTDYAGDWLGESMTLRQLSLKSDQLILLSENQDGERMLYIIPWRNNQYSGMMLAGPLPPGASLDLFHAGEDELIVQWFGERGDAQCGFEADASGIWQLKWVMGKGNLIFTSDSVASADEGILPLRNDGVYYGEHPWQTIMEIDFDRIPFTLEEALASLDQSGYAVVNNPNPEDRLHLRELPRKDARSFGKFYNRTPVRVHTIQGEWANVSIGSISGWMMRAYLAFGDEMESVECAFPQMYIREGIKKIQLRRYRNGGTPDVIDRDTPFYIVGVEGENYVILTEDGCTGYVVPSLMDPGNG